MITGQTYEVGTEACQAKCEMVCMWLICTRTVGIDPPDPKPPNLPKTVQKWCGGADELPTWMHRARIHACRSDENDWRIPENLSETIRNPQNDRKSSPGRTKLRSGARERPENLSDGLEMCKHGYVSVLICTKTTAKNVSIAKMKLQSLPIGTKTWRTGVENGWRSNVGACARTHRALKMTETG